MRRLELAIVDTGGPGLEEWFVLEAYCRRLVEHEMEMAWPALGWLHSEIPLKGFGLEDLPRPFLFLMCRDSWISWVF